MVEGTEYTEQIESIREWHHGQKKFWDQKTPDDSGMLDGFLQVN